MIFLFLSSCLSICRDFDIGGGFTRVPGGESLTIRTQDLVEYACADGFYVDGSDYTVSKVVKECLPDGTFADQIQKCKKVRKLRISLESSSGRFCTAF